LAQAVLEVSPGLQSPSHPSKGRMVTVTHAIFIAVLLVWLPVHGAASAAPTEEAHAEEELDDIAALQVMKSRTKTSAAESALQEQEDVNAQLSGTFLNSTISEADKQMWLREHNIYRCMHQAPAVEWDDAVYQNAQTYVDKLMHMTHSKSYDIPPPAGPAGENLAMGRHSINRVVADWYNEERCCNSLPGCESVSQGSGCGTTMHFTAVVWKAVKKIGCAKNHRNIYICRYWSGNTKTSDTANMRGGFSTNVLAKTTSAEECRKSFGGGGDDSCKNTPGWKSRTGKSCKTYEEMGWCKNGSAGPFSGWFANFPEKNCCACGKKAEPRACQDTPGWKNPSGYSCEDYALGWCADGRAAPGYEWTIGSDWNNPEQNCCVCGKGG